MTDEIQDLHGEPIQVIRRTNSDVAKIIVGESEPYQSIRVSGARLTVERGPEYEEQRALRWVSDE